MINIYYYLLHILLSLDCHGDHNTPKIEQGIRQQQLHHTHTHTHTPADKHRVRTPEQSSLEVPGDRAFSTDRTERERTI